MIFEICIHLILVCSVIILCCLLWWSWSRRVIRATLPNNQYRPARLFTTQKRIALVCDAATPAVRRLRQGLKRTLRRNTRIEYHVDLFEGHRRNETARAHLRTIMKNGYDCIVSAGLFSTQIAQDVIARSETPLPVVFGMVSETENHIVQHPIAHNWTTGVLTNRNLTVELSRLAYLTPRINRTLIVTPHEHWNWIDKELGQIKDFLRMQHSSVEVYQLEDQNLEPIISQLAQLNLLIIMSQAATPQQISTLAKSCQHFEVTLYATDIDDVSHGAAIGTGGGEEVVGSEIGHKVRHILEDHIPPKNLAISMHQPPHRIRLNRKAALEQAVLLSHSDLFVIGRGETTRNR